MLYTRIATAPSVQYFTPYSQRTVRNCSGAEAKLAVALYGLSVQVSCLLVFTVHEIVPPSCCIYFEGGARGSTYSPSMVHIPYTVNTMRQLLHVHTYLWPTLWTDNIVCFKWVSKEIYTVQEEDQFLAIFPVHSHCLLVYICCNIMQEVKGLTKKLGGRPVSMHNFRFIFHIVYLFFMVVWPA